MSESNKKQFNKLFLIISIIIISLIIIFTLTSLILTNTETTYIHPDSRQGKITKIIDGDTVDIDSIRYRLSLIDTPERGESGFMEATNALKMLCPIDSLVYYHDDSIQKTDNFGRHLGVIWCQGNDYNTTAGQYMYQQGHLKKFYNGFCDVTEAATENWAETTKNWFYFEICN